MRWLVVLAFVFITGCHKGDPEKCDQMCRHYAELVFWEEANAEIEKLPPEQRDAARKDKQAMFSRNLANGVDMCTSKCVSADYKKDVDCVIAAKTAAEAKACMTK
jgi:hypothetical protein